MGAVEQLARAYNEKGLSLNCLQKYMEAKKCFEMAIELNETQYKYYINLGVTVALLGDNEESIEILDKAIEGLENEVKSERETGFDKAERILSELSESSYLTKEETSYLSKDEELTFRFDEI